MKMNKLLLHAITWLRLRSNAEGSKKAGRKGTYYLMKNQVVLIYAVRHQGSNPFTEGFLCAGLHIKWHAYLL